MTAAEATLAEQMLPSQYAAARAQLQQILDRASEPFVAPENTTGIPGSAYAMAVECGRLRALIGIIESHARSFLEIYPEYEA